MNTDPIADMLTRIRNANLVSHATVEMPSSKLKIELAKLLKDRDLVKARELLKTCLKLSPGYKPAIRVLADTYRESDPGIADKYIKQLNAGIEVLVCDYRGSRILFVGS